MNGGFLIVMEVLGNGVGMIGVKNGAVHACEFRVRQSRGSEAMKAKPNTVSCAAGLGTMRPGSAARPFAAGTGLASAAGSSGFGWLWSPVRPVRTRGRRPKQRKRSPKPEASRGGTTRAGRRRSGILRHEFPIKSLKEDLCLLLRGRRGLVLLRRVRGCE